MMTPQSDKSAPSFWTPSRDRVEKSNLTAFTKYLSSRIKKSFSTYVDLYNWSIDESATFWESIWDFHSVLSSRKYSSVLEGSDIRKAVWFKDARLNFAENLLRHKSDKEAIVFWSEKAAPVRLSHHELFRQVEGLADAFIKAGVKKNDRVAALTTNRPEAIIGMLAASSIGAVWSSCSPDFGFQGVLERFGPIRPKVLIAVNGYSYNGKEHDVSETIRRISSSIPEIDKIVMIRSLVDVPLNLNEKCVSWDVFLSKHPQPLKFEALPFDHPLYIMYSSGTTGKPKCIVHSAGGTLLQHLKELGLHTNLKEGDVITYFTTCGWMMWNWLVSSLALGATLFLYDGSPSYPNFDVLYRAIDDERISILGTSPKFLSACQSSGLKPKLKFDLSSMHTILSTGSPLLIQNFKYVYDSIKSDVQLSSISGGTDIISCFMLGNPNLPVYAGELQCRGLGMKVEAFNPEGKPVIDQVGELVCTAPFPSRPVYFLDDADGEKYRNAYFKEYPNHWCHGDYIKINSRGGSVVYGRSDATLNPGGVRIGTSEIYGPVEMMDEIEESLVIGKKADSDIKVILFVVLAKGHTLTEELKEKIKNQLRTTRTPRHVPAEIHAVSDIPRTLNGKKVEVTVAKIIHGEEITNRDAIANPKALDQFQTLFNYTQA